MAFPQSPSPYLYILVYNYMAKRKDIASYVFENFTLGQIQAGTLVPRHNVSEDEEGNRKYKTVLKKVKGTNIPASTLYRMQLPADDPRHLKPGKKTIDKLNKFYHRFAYNSVRRYGGGIEYSKKASRYPPFQLKEILREGLDNAKRIAESRGVPVEYVLAGLAQSRKFSDMDALDRYLEDEGIIGLSIRQKKKSYAEIALFPRYNKSKL